LPLTDRTVCEGVGTSVNSVVSWLSTVAKAWLLISLKSGLGQLTWIWFGENERPLADLEVFDAGTRGLTGSLGLI
jgi:hypothetical protein